MFAIETISEQLRRELPGLRGFGVSNIKNMRQFYESWNVAVNRQPTAGDLDWHEFFSLSFTHHMEILSKTRKIIIRSFYKIRHRKRVFISPPMPDFFTSAPYIPSQH